MDWLLIVGAALLGGIVLLFFVWRAVRFVMRVALIGVLLLLLLAGGLVFWWYGSSVVSSPERDRRTQPQQRRRY